MNAFQGPVTGREIYLEKIKENQNQDNELCHIKDQLNKNTQPEDIETENFKEISHNMHVKNGFVFARLDGLDNAVIPYKDRERFVINTHLDPMLVHVVKEKLVDRISMRAYVSNSGKIINQITNDFGRCIPTIQKRAKSEKQQLYPMPIPNNIFNRWHIDLAGPYMEIIRNIT